MQLAEVICSELHMMEFKAPVDARAQVGGDAVADARSDANQVLCGFFRLEGVVIVSNAIVGKAEENQLIFFLLDER